MSDDTISRQAAIELWEEYHPYIAVKACEYGKRLRSLPSAERHGRWKQVGDNTYRCSVCGELSCCCSPYCGECGAKMDEVEE